MSEWRQALACFLGFTLIIGLPLLVAIRAGRKR